MLCFICDGPWRDRTIELDPGQTRLSLGNPIPAEKLLINSLEFERNPEVVYTRHDFRIVISEVIRKKTLRFQKMATVLSIGEPTTPPISFTSQIKWEVEEPNFLTEIDKWFAWACWKHNAPINDVHTTNYRLSRI